MLDRMLLLAVLVGHPPLTGREAQLPTRTDREGQPPIGPEAQLPTRIGREGQPPIPIGPEAQPPTRTDREGQPPIGPELRHNNARQDNPIAAAHPASSVLPTAVATVLARQGMVRHAHRATVPGHTEHLTAAQPQ